MANVRIFQKGNNVQLNDDATGTIIALIPSRSFRFEPQEQYAGFVIRDWEARERVRQYLYSEALDEAGAPIGGEAAVIDYLAPLVGFDPAGGGGEANTQTNQGAGQGTLALPKVGVDLPIKTILAGTNITVTNNADTVEIASTDTGEANTASSAGGTSLVLPKVGVDLPFKGLVAGTGIDVSVTAITLDIALADMPANTVKVNATGAVAAPADLVMGPSTILARLAAGDIVAATTAEIATLLAGNWVDLTTLQNNIDGQKTFIDRLFRQEGAGAGIGPSAFARDFTITTDQLNGGMSILTNTGGNANIFLGTPMDNAAATIQYIQSVQELRFKVKNVNSFRVLATRVQMDVPLRHLNTTTVVRDALPSPIAGMVVFNTDTNSLQFYDGVAWQNPGDGLANYGEFFMNNNVTVTPLSLNTPAKMVGTTTAGVSKTFNITNGRVQYKGPNGGVVKITAAVGAAKDGAGADRDIIYYIAKNNVVIAKSAVKRFTADEAAAIAVQCLDSPNNNDFYELWLENIDNNDDMIIENINFIVTQIDV